MPHPKGSLKHKLHVVVFEADTPRGKLFDVVLLVLIFLSVIVVMLETVPSINKNYQSVFKNIEWVVTVLFTIEYFVRIYVVKKPMNYIKSFYGIIDLLAILPTYLSLFLPGSHILAVVRALRLLRVFKILEMSSFTYQSKIIMLAMRSSLPKIAVFIYFVIILVTIFGTIIYFVEGGVNEDINSIPQSIYYSITTLSTVGYGDILFNKASTKQSNQACENCSREGHDQDAVHCKYCGDKLHDD